MAQRLTEKAVERLGSRREAYIKWDAGAVGLGLKITPAGKRIWICQLKYPGHKVQTRRTLGIYPALGVAAARAKADRWYALAKGGVDPAEAELNEARALETARRAEALRRENTFASVAERYIKNRSHFRRAKADENEIRRMLIKPWGEKPIHEIKARDVRMLVEGLKTKAPYDARNAWTHSVGIFKAAVHEELIEVSPCASLDRKLVFQGAKLAPRQRVLDDTEVFALWRAAGRVGYPAGPFYRLLLLLGCRVSELGKAKWGEFHPEIRQLIREARRSDTEVDWSAVDSAVKVWTIPRERFKSDAEHIVPLSDDALTIIADLPPMGDLLFTLNGKKPVWVGDKFKKRIDDRMLKTLQAMARKRGDDPVAVRLKPWINHDLRRVVRTNLSALDTPDHIAEMVLGHGRKGLQRIYDQHRYLPQIREALGQWAARLRTIVGPAPAAPPVPSKVVTLRPRRRAAS